MEIPSLLSQAAKLGKKILKHQSEKLQTWKCALANWTKISFQISIYLNDQPVELAAPYA